MPAAHIKTEYQLPSGPFQEGRTTTNPDRSPRLKAPQKVSPIRSWLARTVLTGTVITGGGFAVHAIGSMNLQSSPEATPTAVPTLQINVRDQSTELETVMARQVCQDVALQLSANQSDKWNAVTYAEGENARSFLEACARNFEAASSEEPWVHLDLTSTEATHIYPQFAMHVANTGTALLVNRPGELSALFSGALLRAQQAGNTK